jgi:hypothetical protein
MVALTASGLQAQISKRVSAEGLPVLRDRLMREGAE